MITSLSLPVTFIKDAAITLLVPGVVKSPDPDIGPVAPSKSVTIQVNVVASLSFVISMLVVSPEHKVSPTPDITGTFLTSIKTEAGVLAVQP